MKVRIKRLDKRAVVPSYSKKGDAGLDFTAVNISKDNVGNITYHTGLAVAIPDGAKSTVKCNDCGSEQVIFQEGCQTCQSCGSSKCS